MKKTVLFLIPVLLVLSIFSQNTENLWPVLKGPYLGQKPPGLTPKIFAPGIISTEKRELNSVFSPKGDEFYFTIYYPKPANKCVIMVSRQIEGVWTKPRPASFSGQAIDVDMAFSQDGKKLYFCSTRLIRRGSNAEAKHDIWFCDRQKNNQWSDPKNLGPVINSQEIDVYPSFTINGKMYFSSLRTGGNGNMDIYYSELIDGEFSKPVNVGSPINTKYGEGDTFVAPDESFLIVSSRGRPDSVGGSDLYISYKHKDGNWSAAKNLGQLVNTGVYEYSPMISPDGKYLFFSRFSDDGSDIYWVDAKIIKKLSKKGSN